MTANEVMHPYHSSEDKRQQQGTETRAARHVDVNKALLTHPKDAGFLKGGGVLTYVFCIPVYMPTAPRSLFFNAIRQMSRREMPSKAHKKSNNSERRRSDSWGGNNIMGPWLTSHIRIPSRAQPTALSAQNDDVDPLNTPAAGSDFPSPLQEVINGGGSQGGGRPVPSEVGDGGRTLGGLGGASGEPSSEGPSSAWHASGGHVSEAPPRIGELVGLETPPPLTDLNRRASLVDDNYEEPPEGIAEELMIGEIKVTSNVKVVKTLSRVLGIISASLRREGSRFRVFLWFVNPMNPKG